MINWISGVLVVFIAILVPFQEGDNIRYFQPSTAPINDSTTTVTESIYDSLSAEDILQVSTVDGIPLYYYVELNTGVCFDNKCRPLSISIFWNITGRYLGFELLDGEFLSKYDHEPFTPAEYERLHELLANPFLPLGDYSFDELVSKPDTNSIPIDGVSGATNQEVLDYVVDGAAYTTHKLWKFIYGPIQQQVISLTEKQLDASLFEIIIKSPDQSDRTWALERIGLLLNLNDSIIDTCIDIILEGEYFQAYIILKSLSSDHLRSETLQVNLFNLIGKVDASIENLIIDKLTSAPYLSHKVIERSTSTLKSLSGPQLVSLLKLYKKHQVSNPDICSQLRSLADNKNSYVKNQLLDFVESAGCK